MLHSDCLSDVCSSSFEWRRYTILTHGSDDFSLVGGILNTICDNKGKKTKFFFTIPCLLKIKPWIHIACLDNYIDNSLAQIHFPAPQDLPLRRWSSQHRCLRSSWWWCRGLFRRWPQGCWYSHGDIHKELWCRWRVHCWIEGEKASLFVALLDLVSFLISFLLHSAICLLSSPSLKSWIKVMEYFYSDYLLKKKPWSIFTWDTNLGK